MAIIIEEEKNSSKNTPAVLGWIIIIVVVLVAGYFIYLAPPPSVVVKPPANFEKIAPIAQINFDPTTLVNSAPFQSLKEYISEPTSTGPVGVGKANPFIQ